MGSLKPQKYGLVMTLGLLLSGCQMGYIMKSGYGQLQLLNSRVPLEEALQSPSLDEDKKIKLRLAVEARKFAENKLHLKPTKNYTTYVELGRPYVTYVVSAAPKWELKHYEWSYPFMGKMPYKGYFDENDAKAEEADLKNQNLDTFLRGVPAYSTLGWFNDPILSSMLKYDNYDLVNTIIHETVHATLYIKNSADFNERLATFLGNKGAEQFYLEKEGSSSPTLQKIREENEDAKIFSAFISKEIEQLKNWYKNLSSVEHMEEARIKRFALIQENFRIQILPQLKTPAYKKFQDIKLNNARLLIYKTYMQNLDEFERLYALSGYDFQKFIDSCRPLEKAKNPEEQLRTIINQTRPSF